MLAAFRDGTATPSAASPHHGMPCCEAKLCGHEVASLVFDFDQVPISIMLARRGEMKCHGDGTIVRDGHAYVVAQAGGLNMVMEERSGRWLCLVGQVPQDQLIALIRQLTF